MITCKHSVDTELSDNDHWGHFSECLSWAEAKEQMLQWRDAARKWWDHQDAVMSQHLDPPAPGHVCPAPVSGEVRGSTAWHTYEAKDMHVLPGFTSLMCAMEESVDFSIMETFTARDLGVMRALLGTALTEVTNAQNQESQRVYQAEQQRWYPPAPAQAALNQLKWSPEGSTL